MAQDSPDGDSVLDILDYLQIQNVLSDKPRLLLRTTILPVDHLSVITLTFPLSICTPSGEVRKPKEMIKIHIFQ